MQEIIEESRISQYWLASHEVLEYSEDHAFLIIVSLGAMPMHGLSVHIVTVTMTHVLLSLMSVYLDLT